MRDSSFFWLSRASGLLIGIVLLAIVAILWKESFLAFDKFGLEFLWSTQWIPNKEIFGALPSAYGSVVGGIIAMMISIPISLGIGIFLSCIATPRLKLIIGVCVELLASIPSIVYGMVGLFYLVPLVQSVFGGSGHSILTASIVLSVMVLPIMSAIIRDSMDNTPNLLKEGAFALGGTKFEVIKDVILPYAKVGVIGSIILSLARVFGETMAVTFVIGNTYSFPDSILSPTTNIPATLANQFAEADSPIYYSSLFYLALILFFINLVVISIAKLGIRK